MESTNPAPRFSLKLPMRYRPKGERRWRESMTSNLSSTGTLFATVEPLPPGKLLEIEITMAAGLLKPGLIRTFSEVIRQNAEDEFLITAVRHLQYQLHQDPTAQPAVPVAQASDK